MEEITEEPVQVVARVCAIDIGKAGLVACVRVPHAGRPEASGLTLGEVLRTPDTFYRVLDGRSGTLLVTGVSRWDLGRPG